MIWSYLPTIITEVRFDFTPPYPTKYRFSIFPKLVLPKKQAQINALENYGDPEDNWEIIREILNENIKLLKTYLQKKNVKT